LHDYGGAACHHGFCAAMTPADGDEALGRLDAALSDRYTVADLEPPHRC
jgi:hypothetical protein